MTTSTSSWLETALDNLTSADDDFHSSNTESTPISKSFLITVSKWTLRLFCIAVFILCPLANYYLIKLFQIRPYYNQSSAKWYIIFKAAFDTLYAIVSTPLIFFLTYNLDLIHKNYFTCITLTYIHYFSDDLISFMLTLLSLDRMIRIVCNYRIREQFSLIVCSIAVGLFLLINIHHIVRLRHTDGICHKIYVNIGDYDFDIYYSFLYTLTTWTIIFIASINLIVSICCDRAKRLKLKEQQLQLDTQNISVNRDGIIGHDSDRLELINHTDDWEIQDSTVVTIENNPIDTNRFIELNRQDNADLQITVCVVITSIIFLVCNIPNFIIFVSRFVLNLRFNTFGYIFIYISLYLLFVSHTISYFIFNHLTAKIFSNNFS